VDRIGRYEIISELGRGAMGVVYRARDPKIGREVAIKTIKWADRAEESEISNLRERLFREAQSAGKLSHPGIVTIYDIDEVEGEAFIAMELVEGETLESMMHEDRPLELSFVGDFLRQTSAALDYAHSKGIVHRDVKPANVMIVADGGIKIMDFGIARVTSSQLTQTGTVMGTPSYMSPEQVKGETVEGRSDQFSFGVIAYEMLTGRKPFVGENLTSVIFQIVSSEPPNAQALNPNVSPGIDATILKALSKDINQRYATCREFAQAFASALHDLPQGAAGQVGAAGFDPNETAAPAPISEIETDDGAGATTAAAGKVSESRPASSPTLPPLGAKPAESSDVADETLFSAYEPIEEPKRDWKKGFAIAAAVIVAALLAVGFTSPWLLNDPGATLRILAGQPAPVNVNPSGFVAAVRESFDTPPPDEALTAGFEIAFIERQRLEAEAQAAAQAQEASNPDPPRPPPPPRKVAVYFRSNRLGATVTVDERPDWSCQAPCRISDLPAGQHTAVAVLAGYHPLTRRLDLGARNEEVIQLDLEDARIILIVTSEPSGADIFVDGAKRSETTNAKIPLSPGTYQVRVSKEGVGSAEQVVVVNKDQLPLARFVLQ